MQGFPSYGGHRFSTSMDPGLVVREGSNGAGMMGLYSPLENPPAVSVLGVGHHGGYQTAAVGVY